ncbi:MAG: signal peptide peptidase SppA [Gemmatimonadota bacterium]
MARRSVYTILVVAVLSLMVLAGLVLAVITSVGGGRTLTFGNRIAIIEVEGIIGDDREVLENIRDFRDDASVKGFVVAINSPGGEVGPSQSIYREIKRLRDEDDRPVIAAINSVGASGGYYIALGADSIYANPGAITGSIGVIMEMPNVGGLLEKVGVEMQVVKSAEHKDIGSPFRRMSPSDSAVLGAMVMDVYTQFVEVVSAERKKSRAELGALVDGRVLSGRQAMQSGLIDRVGNFNDAVAAAGRMAGLGATPKLLYPPKDEVTLWDALMGRAEASIANRLARPLDQATTPRVKFILQ